MAAGSSVPNSDSLQIPEGGQLARRRALVGLGMFAAVTTGNAYLLLSAHQPLSVYGLFIASAILWVCAVPFAVFLLSSRPTLAFAPIASGLYAVYYAMPIFRARPLFRGSMREPVWSSVEFALEYALLGAVALVVGACATGGLLRRLPRVRRDIDFSRAVPALLAMSSIGFVVRVVRAGSSLPRFDIIFSAIEQIGMMGLGGLLIAWLRGHLQVWQKVYLVALTLGIAAIGLAAATLANVAYPMAALVFVYCWERHRIPWALVIASALLLAPFQATKYEFRAKHWTSTTEGMSPANIPMLVGAFASSTIAAVQSGEVSSDTVLDANERRTDALATMAIVTADTPDAIPYWDGYTYSDLAWHVIPRILVPDRPSLVMGQEFPLRYGLIAYDSRDTTYNLPQMVELYINFGPLGIAIGMLIIGLIYAILDQAASASSGGALIGAVIFSTLMNMESNFSQVFGSIHMFFLVCYVVIRFVPSVRGGSDSEALPHGYGAVNS